MHTLITPLDWGLGHASRSLALARRLEAEGDRISWASSGPAAAMLRRELPGQAIYELPAYRVTYGSKRMAWNVARQLLHWTKTIRAECRATDALVRKLGVDRIVSDSRFGCYHSTVPSVFLTHQLHPITHFAPASAAYTWQLRHFDEFWVPDDPGHDRLSGKLSAATGFAPVHYIGPLSRLTPSAGLDPFDLLILLSGPEPMRTHLEEIILRQLPNLPYSYRLVRGLPEGTPLTTGEPTSLPYADTPTLNQLVTAARCVVARPGYSTMMDLRALDKRAILVATPGQTEQFYLAQRAQLQGWALAVMDQERLELPAAVARILGAIPTR